MKLVYAVAFKKIKPLRECKNCKSDHLEMEIIGECALDKSMEGPGKTSKKTWKTIYEVIYYEYFKQLDVVFPKYFLLKCKQEFNFYHLILLMSKKNSKNWS